MNVFGPVPSRRLGQSLGINNIPPKTCSYACVYCQIGRTNRMQITRSAFYKPEDLLRETENKLNALQGANKPVDFITFVPDGEPTLDQNLGVEIRLLRQFGVKIAVITNASLLWMDAVKDDLMHADWVSIKIDAVNNDIWHKIDRPHGCLQIEKILAGAKDFARHFHGTLVAETMLIKNRNDTKECVAQIGAYLAQIKPARAYLLTPTRPPAESGVQPLEKGTLSGLCTVLSRAAGIPAEYVAADDEDGFFTTDDAVNELLSIMSVHPIREDTVKKLLCEKNYGADIIHHLVKRGMIKEILYENKKFYLKNLEQP